MQLEAIQMEAGAAKEALRQYRADLKASRERSRTEIDRELALIDDAVMRGYRALGRGHRVLELSKTLAAGGTTLLEAEGRFWREGSQWKVDVAVLLPALAISRADARSCWTRALQLGETKLEFQADGWQWNPRRADSISLEREQIFDIDVELGIHQVEPYNRDERSALSNLRLKAMAPTIPPALRPPHALRGYHLLWEAEWAVGSMIPPGDPALLKHLGGDLFAVLAVWDLTPLERAALAQVRA